MPRELRYGMVGGGRGAFIGGVHRVAAAMDGRAKLVAGAFSSDPGRARASGADLGVSPDRNYTTYAEMARAESRLSPDRRLDFVIVVTPNHLHFPVARTFLGAGFHVVCDKPVATSLADARRLQRLVRRSGRLFMLTHNYSGNAMVLQARAMVRSGALGSVRKIVVEYPQGWLATPLERTGHPQAGWKTDPRRSGPGGCIADIGVHAEHLVRFVTGLRLDAVCADLTTFVVGRRLDDDNSILLHYHGGAKGVLLASQISIGEDNNLRLRIYGSKASLEWQQENADELVVRHAARPREIWRRGHDYNDALVRRAARIPAGHTEGYLEAFANLYRAFYGTLDAESAGRPRRADPGFPTVDDGVAGMAFVEAALRSAAAGGCWTKVAR